MEIIVVDGNSHDGTAAVVEGYGARLIQTSADRALQLNKGAEAAHGDILLFLHSDTKPEPGFVKQVRDTLNQTGVAAGAFQLSINGKKHRRCRALARRLTGVLKWPT